MARPRAGDWATLKRIGRYLLGKPRLVVKFDWQQVPKHVDCFTDSDWAGCKTTCRSTSGGVLQLGGHCLKTWSSSQATVALSSAEAELYALTKGSAQALGAMSLLQDFGVVVNAKVHADASAAIGIARRTGLGKLRHLNVRYLWIQDQVRLDNFELLKVKGTSNPADLLTKHLSGPDVEKNLSFLNMYRPAGRADSAPTLNAFLSRDEEQLHALGGIEEESPGLRTTFQHDGPRRRLFTPSHVAGAPSCSSLTSTRITTGIWVDTGKCFTITDSWRSRTEAHRDLGAPWTGHTKFVLKEDSTKMPLHRNEE